MKMHLRRLAAVALGLGISLSGVSTALAANMTFTADYIVDFSNPDVSITIVSGSVANSVVVTDSDMQVVIANGDSMTITSANTDIVVANETSATIDTTCETGNIAQVIIQGGADGETLTISPFGDNCGDFSGGGGGGGGSGSSNPTTPPPAVVHGPGSVVSTTDGTVWFITNDSQRRPFTSAGAFLSYGFLSWSQVVPANSGDTALTAGSFIAPRDGSIFCATATKGTDVAGECSLITGGQKAAFTSEAVFTGLGFSFSRAQYGDSSFLAKTTDVSNTTDAHRAGVLVNNSGTIQLVGASSLVGIPSMAVMQSWGYAEADVVPANTADKALPQSGVMVSRVAGQLNP
jgi:hypothetical protein